MSPPVTIEYRRPGAFASKNKGNHSSAAPTIQQKQTRSDSGHSPACEIIDVRGRTPTSNTDVNLRESILNAIQTKNVGFTDPKTGEESCIRSIPTMVLYDDKGLDIFDQITYIDEYYLTNCEIDILKRNAEEIVNSVASDNAVFIELGCGSMRKTKYLLEAIERKGLRNVTYYPVDLSRSSLQECIGPLTLAFPTITFLGLLGCYEDAVHYVKETLPATTRKTFLWLGSSIGNLNREQAGAFLRHVCQEGMNEGDVFVCGIDRRNESALVGSAYNDSHGLTRDFIINGLDHVNRIFGVNIFDRGDFEYVSIYNDREGRHEAYYKSLRRQTLTFPCNDGTTSATVNVTLESGEMINVEYSYKYSKTEVQQLTETAKLYYVGKWTDNRDMYDLCLFQKPPFWFEKNATRPAVPTIAEWQELWKAWDTITTPLRSEPLTQPIQLRHPYVFYLGHIPAFLDIQISRALNPTEPSYTSPQDFPRIFERGIDPDMNDPLQCHPHSEVPEQWPAITQVVAYAQRVRRRVQKIMSEIETNDELRVNKRLMRVLWMCYEHEAMHLETILYMIVQQEKPLPPHKVLAPLLPATPPTVPPLSFHQFSEVPSTIMTGLDDPEAADFDGNASYPEVYGWDNEKPVRELPLKPFAISDRKITIGDWIKFLDDHTNWDSADIPSSWLRVNAGTDHSATGYFLRTLHGQVPLQRVLHLPVQVSYDQALRYAKVRGTRLPTEAELRYLRREQKSLGAAPNYGFQQWIPATVDTVVGDLWEWTGSVMDRSEKDGYVKSETYPGYSSDFFDGKHNIVLGGSWATVPRLSERESLVNWYQRGYPYVFAGFRLARDI
ncbi:hypothetical protein BC832DRAFT_601763 [Gaertneriomyces semiglobifer]|nr:hypothetical protein BC832DRAFT_601763 [Gaertneriomyces semiglobifer]